MTSRRVLRAPFPWFGGKSLAAPLIWRAFGNVPNYVEPFAGSLAVLLARPHAAKVETANDKDGLIANFWRAVKHAPDAVAEHSDWPVNEADLHARHRWLVGEALPLVEKLIADPEWYDAKVAGWWAWGVSTWTGARWCHAERVDDVERWLPAIGKPGQGVHSPTRRGLMIAFFRDLAERLRHVRVCCGDWSRVLGDSTLGLDNDHAMVPCAVLLDPPYAHRVTKKRTYREDDAALSRFVQEWAIARGDDPRLRIALCSFEGEHEMPSSWRCSQWKSHSPAAKNGRERIWFSPHCLDVTRQGELFAPAEAVA